MEDDDDTNTCIPDNLTLMVAWCPTSSLVHRNQMPYREQDIFLHTLKTWLAHDNLLSNVSPDITYHKARNFRGIKILWITKNC